MEALGRVALGDHNGPLTDTIATALFDFVTNKQEELQVCGLPWRIIFCAHLILFAFLFFFVFSLRLARHWRVWWPFSDLSLIKVTKHTAAAAAAASAATAP